MLFKNERKLGQCYGSVFPLHCTYSVLSFKIINFFFIYFFQSLNAHSTNMKLHILLATVVAFVSLSIASEEKKDKDIGTVIGIDLGTTYSW